MLQAPLTTKGGTRIITSLARYRPTVLDLWLILLEVQQVREMEEMSTRLRSGRSISKRQHKIIIIDEHHPQLQIMIPTGDQRSQTQIMILTTIEIAEHRQQLRATITTSTHEQPIGLIKKSPRGSRLTFKAIYLFLITIITMKTEHQ